MAAVFPGAVATNANVLVANDGITTNLIAPMLIGDTSAAVASTLGWSANMVATIGSEQMLVTSVLGSNVLNVTRGQYGTSAAAHAAAAAVSNFVDAVYHNAVKDEVIAIETALGALLANIPGSPNGGVVPVAKGGTGVTSAQGVGGTKVQLAAGTTTLGNVPKYDANGALVDSGVTPSIVPAGTAPFQRFRAASHTPFSGEFKTAPVAYVPDFNYTAQAPGGSLVGGGGPQAVTLTPVPVGLIANGAYASVVYLSNGTGTAEAVVCAGGSAVSGASSGTILISPLNNHSGAWTVSSASDGLQEAINYQYLTYVGGTVELNPQAAVTVHARIPFPAGNFSINGQGGATARIDRAADYPTGDLLYMNPSSAFYTNIQNLRILNNTAAAQTAGAAIACVLNRMTVSNLYVLGGYECIRLDGAPGAHIENFDMSRDLSADHTSALIRLTAAVSGGPSTDVIIQSGQLFASNTSIGIDVQSADGLTILGVQGGGGNPSIKLAPGGTSANGFYLGNIDIIGLLWDGWKNGNAGIQISGRAGSGVGDVSILGGRLLGAPGAVPGVGSYGVLITPGTGSTPSATLIEGVTILYTDDSGIVQNGLGSLPTQIINCQIHYTNLGTHASTPGILMNGGNCSIKGCSMYSNTATWQIGCESTCGSVEIVGNYLAGAITAPVSLNMGFGDWPSSLVMHSNLGVDNVIGTLASAATVTLPVEPNFTITGTTNITSLLTGIVGVGPAWPGRSGIITAPSGVLFVAGGTIGNTFKIHAGGSAAYYCDASNKIYLVGLNLAPPQIPNYYTDGGANNAITATLTGLTLADGLQVTIQLAHTLQAGANTFNALTIRSSRNTANNIGVAYAATGRITLQYSSTIPCWIDMAQ